MRNRKKPFLVELEFLIEATTHRGAVRIVEREFLATVVRISKGKNFYVKTWQMKKAKDRERMLGKARA